MATFTREQLEGMTSKDLKRLCVEELHIPGMTKKPKGVVMDAILSKFGGECQCGESCTCCAANPVDLTGIEFSGRSVMTNPGGKFGTKTTTTIHVSSGASSGNFPVVGRSVKQVGEFLREVLNLDRLSTGLVNGQEVNADYILKENDRLEFLKPAGQKG